MMVVSFDEFCSVGYEAGDSCGFSDPEFVSDFGSGSSGGDCGRDSSIAEGSNEVASSFAGVKSNRRA